MRLHVRNTITAVMIEKHTGATIYGVNTGHVAHFAIGEWDFIMAAFGDDRYATQSEYGSSTGATEIEAELYYSFKKNVDVCSIFGRKI